MPRFWHDCDDCEPAGEYIDCNGFECDGYVCERGGEAETVILRYSGDGPSYSSVPVKLVDGSADVTVHKADYVAAMAPFRECLADYRKGRK